MRRPPSLAIAASVGSLVLATIVCNVYCNDEDPSTKLQRSHTGSIQDAELREKLSKPRRKLPKDPLYINDVDLEALYDQWEESDEEKIPPDELPPHQRRPQVNIPSKDAFADPDKLMRASKKGITVMAFASIGNNPSREESEEITARWQVGLSNNHMRCNRFLVADDRAVFVFEDGSLAFDAKEFFLQQPELKEYSIDNRSWQGPAYPVEYPNQAEREKSPDSSEQPPPKGTEHVEL